MIESHQRLWHKINNFQFDEPNVSFPFSKNLAKEQHWSDAFTQKAIALFCNKLTDVKISQLLR